MQNVRQYLRNYSKTKEGKEKLLKLSEKLIDEALDLAGRGVKELVLVAQETTLYGIDLYGKKMLPELVRRLCGIEGIEWIRLLYCYPEEITDELIDVIKNEPKVVHYIDMPVQSGSDRILGLMGRKTDRKQILGIIKKLRDNIPDICIRTTLIAGFPGEKKADHEETLAFIKEAEFNRLGCFKYSAEEGTVAEKMDHQVSERTKKSRLNDIMLAQQEIAFRHNDTLKNEIVSAFVEGYIREDDIYVCRTYMDAPDVDGLLFVTSDKELESGRIIKARILGYNDYDLIGEYIDQDEFTK